MNFCRLQADENKRKTDENKRKTDENSLFSSVRVRRTKNDENKDYFHQPPAKINYFRRFFSADENNYGWAAIFVGCESADENSRPLAIFVGCHSRQK